MTHRENVIGKAESVWIDTTSSTQYDSLEKNINVDIAIVGGGIVGLHCASLLEKEGFSIAVIESRKIVTGVTGYTTAKVTALHNLVYNHLQSQFGEEKARMYGEANSWAIEAIERNIKKLKIDCDFKRTSAYTYTISDDEIKIIEKEVEVAKKFGLPATFTTETELPYDIKGAVKFENQAQFHPRKYLLGLVKSFSNRVSIYEKTRVTDVEETENYCNVITGKGKVKAKYVILATNFPIIDKGMFFSRLYPHRSLAIGVHIDEKVPEGLYISTEQNFRSVRNQPVKNGSIVIIGGEPYKTGQGGDIIDRYENLAKFAKENFKVKSIDYHWSTQDFATGDKVPYIGKNSPGSHRMFMATGFGGWGMTHSMVSAKLLTDLILNKKNSWKDLYDPHRIKPLTSGKKFISENINAAKELIKKHAEKPDEVPVEKIKKDEAKIVKVGKDKVGLYRDTKGNLHSVSAVCTHMGCLVTWNNGEKSWDCPCHGSRFSYEGEVLHGPAISNLEKKYILDK